MASDYETIRSDNVKRYGTDIGRVGPMLLADRYDERTHFIFELLQNAEDALARRSQWTGARSVRFHLSENALSVSHFGQPFNEADVRGVCGIAESTKDLNAIGRFGIGFKSVYAFADRPEVHSGAEDFAIENFVWPTASPPVDRGADETVITIPLRPLDKAGHDEIAAGLGRLGASVLLFLRQIEEIHWTVDGGASGVYLRESKNVDANTREVMVVGQQQMGDEVEETWLVFSRAVASGDNLHAGHVEIAFSLTLDQKSRTRRVQRVERSPLVVFFPTVLETHLGFLVQGPYRTTPSRDNVPRHEPWNQRLVDETASLLVESLRWLRDQDLLDTATLRCVPIDPTKFQAGTMFAPLFAATRQALLSEPLLPRLDGGHVPATRARLARTLELRELFTPDQLTALFEKSEELSWLSGDITQDRAPELHDYLTTELDIAEVTPESIISKLDESFLQAQPDAWILRLYRFLNGQPALRRRLNEVALIRLEDGTHVVARLNGQPQAFLPSTIKTGFPTVRAAVCGSPIAREFLRSLGLTEPDPVDDVDRNVLPKYRTNEVHVGDEDYQSDIRRIVTAFATDSKLQREKLIAALKEATFVMAADAGDGSKWLAKPGDLYVSTERLRELFAGVDDVLFVDDSYACLRGEDIRDLLEACGAARNLQPIPVETDLSWEQRTAIRRSAGLERSRWEKPIADASMRGLQGLLELLPSLDVDTRRRRVGLLWEALSDLESRRGSGAFVAEYTWSYAHESKTATFPAAFVRHLNATAWVPDVNGDLQRPELVVFESLGWKHNPALLTMFLFKPPVIEQLAREAGIEPGVLDLLKKLGMTSEAELRDRLGLGDETPDGNTASREPANSRQNDEPSKSNAIGSDGSTGTGGDGHDGDAAGNSDGQVRGAGSNGKRQRDGNAGRSFISYVGVRPDREEGEPDSAEYIARMQLERQAIELIVSREPAWRLTSTHNPGFDLVQVDEGGEIHAWCEVKAMTGELQDQAVGLSRTQFEHAQRHGEAYWLYIVERAGSDNARIVRVQDPAGKARTFTFDHGWRAVAEETCDSGAS